MRTTCFQFISCGLALACCAVQAQPLLADKELSESRLVEALLPSAVPMPAAAASAVPDAEEEGEFRTRSIRVLRDPTTARVLQSPAPLRAPQKPAAASLLITFITNSAELTPQARMSLDTVARALRDERLGNFNFSIEGHADARGTAEDNLQLSRARAQSVVQYLVDQHQIPRERLQAVGRGDTQLLNRQQIDAPENRRVTIVSLPR